MEQTKGNNICFERLKEHSKNNLGKGTKEAKINQLETELNIKLPSQFREYIEEIGYAEIFGDEIYSIYEVPDKIPCLGLHWMNMQNEFLKDGYIKFFSNDIDGVFYIHFDTGKVYQNSIDNKFSDSFCEFLNKILND